jgi:hypothetical protein
MQPVIRFITPVYRFVTGVYYPDSKEREVPSFFGAKQHRTAKRMAIAIRPAQGIEAEIPQARHGRDEELERIARSPPKAGMRPKEKIHRFNAV